MATKYMSVLAARGISVIIIIIIICCCSRGGSSSSRPDIYNIHERRNQYYRFVALHNLGLNGHEFVERTKEAHFQYRH
jgi:hypothetical protein